MSAAIGADYRAQVIIPGHGFNGIHGLTFHDDQFLYVGSVIGQSIYKVDSGKGEAETYIGLPEGMADDLEFGPDGTLAWTSFTTGIVHAKTGDGPIRRLAEGFPGANSIAFREDGRLFFTQVFLGDALYELDPTGEKEPVKLLENMGGLNGFDFGPDGKLYGPLWFKGQVVRIDVDTKELEVVAEGFETPCAVNFNPDGVLHVLDTKSGKIYTVDTESGEKTEVFEFQPGMDNLAFDSQGRLFVTVMGNNAIYEIDTKKGHSRFLQRSELAVPSDIAVVTKDNRDYVYVADIFSLREVDTITRQVKNIALNYVDELENPIGIYADEDKILVTSWFSGTVQQFGRASGESEILVHDFAAPTDAARLENGDWLVLEGAAGNLTRVSGENKGTRSTIATGLNGCVSIALADQSTAYVTCTEGGRVVAVKLDSGEIIEVTSGLSAPEGLAIDSDNRLVLAETGLRRLIALQPETGEIEVLADRLTIGLPAPAGVLSSYTPTGVAVSDAGTVYFASDLEDALYKLTPK